MIKTLVIITGPTAVGKTSVTIKLAKVLNTEIISCDSRQMYSELSVGTAVPSAEQLLSVKHHFIHNISIHDYYNAFMFEMQCLQLLESLFNTYDIVLMTGGSGLYIDAVINGIDDIPSVDHDVRNSLVNRLKNEGIESLRAELKLCDPEYYKNVDLRNPKRILKALEIFTMTGRPYSSFLTSERKKRKFNIILIGLNVDRQVLHQRINMRTEEMIHHGLISEAREVYPFKDLNSLNTVGYKELFDHFEGLSSLEESIELIKRNTRRYARRQISWFNRYDKIKWMNPDQNREILDFIKKNTK